MVDPRGSALYPMNNLVSVHEGRVRKSYYLSELQSTFLLHIDFQESLPGGSTTGCCDVLPLTALGHPTRDVHWIDVRNLDVNRGGLRLVRVGLRFRDSETPLGTGGGR